MKRFSNCCNAEIHTQAGVFFCTNCIKVLDKEDTKLYLKPYISILSICVFVYMVFNFSYAHAPKMVGLSYIYPKQDNIKTLYAIDYLRIKIIEGNNPNSVSIAGATGNMQIMPVSLNDWNTQHPSEEYTMEDMKNEIKNIRVGKWMLESRIPFILKQANVPLTINHILIAYNWGCGNAIKWYKSGAVINKLPTETQQYICKYWEKATL